MLSVSSPAQRKNWRRATLTAGPVRHRDLDLCLEGPRSRPLSLLFPRGKAAECSTSSTAPRQRTYVLRTSILDRRPSTSRSRYSPSLPRNTCWPRFLQQPTGRQPCTRRDLNIFTLYPALRTRKETAPWQPTRKRSAAQRSADQTRPDKSQPSSDGSACTPSRRSCLAES
ncbi:hypothetical protein N431DRAFT_33885 [Stipitochalara longipes BDJ]|nr:hypothetical protein N431DRAFT_33885 [Stipitochalara longipes BDJ]